MSPELRERQRGSIPQRNQLMPHTAAALSYCSASPLHFMDTLFCLNLSSRVALLNINSELDIIKLELKEPTSWPDIRAQQCCPHVLVTPDTSSPLTTYDHWEDGDSCMRLLKLNLKHFTPDGLFAGAEKSSSSSLFHTQRPLWPQVITTVHTRWLDASISVNSCCRYI